MADWYNEQQGTWIITGEFNNTRIIRDSGNYVNAIGGNGKIVITFDRTNTKVFSSGVLQYTTAPPNELVSGDGVFLCEGISGNLSNAIFVPKFFSDSAAIAEATGNVVLEWIFADDSSIVAKFAEEEYGVRSLTDGADVIRSQDLKDSFTFTRASTKWVFDATGTLVEVPIDQPAYDHDPVTGEALGVLIEESRTNLLTYSEQFDNAAWSSSGGSSSAIVATVTPNTHIAPDGTQTADSVFFDSDGQYRRLQTVSVTAITRYTCSIYVKKGDYPEVQIYLGTANATARIQYNFDTDSITGLDDDSTGVGYRELLPNGWVKLVFGAVAFGTGTTTFGMIQNATSAGHVVLWGAQAEQASTASSYIPTTTAAVTRAADTMSRTLGAEFNGQEGTFYTEHVTVGSFDMVSTSVGLYGADRGERMGFFDDRSGAITTNESAFFVNTNGSTVADITGPLLARNTLVKAAFAFGGGRFVAAVNGVIYGDVALSAIPDVTRLTGQRGNLTSSTGDAKYKNITYYPYTMAAAELEALTAL